MKNKDGLLYNSNIQFKKIDISKNIKISPFQYSSWISVIIFTISFLTSAVGLIKLLFINT